MKKHPIVTNVRRPWRIVGQTPPPFGEIAKGRTGKARGFGRGDTSVVWAYDPTGTFPKPRETVTPATPRRRGAVFTQKESMESWRDVPRIWARPRMWGVARTA